MFGLIFRSLRIGSPMIRQIRDADAMESIMKHSFSQFLCSFVFPRFRIQDTHHRTPSSVFSTRNEKWIGSARHLCGNLLARDICKKLIFKSFVMLGKAYTAFLDDCAHVENIVFHYFWMIEIISPHFWVLGPSFRVGMLRVGGFLVPWFLGFMVY